MRQFIIDHPEFALKDRVLPEKGTQERTNLTNLCASYQEAIVKALVLKANFAMEKALTISGKKGLQLVVGGGVACNSRLRKTLQDKFKDSFFVEPKFCTDNGAMIANFALRNWERAVPFPEGLSLDAKSSFIKKTKL
jgi:N6-L-threonylcarbamoyladenine synthase